MMETSLIRDTAICTITLTTTAVGLRFYSRLRSRDYGLWLDDWLALVAWLIFVPAPCLAIVAAEYKFRRHKLFDDSDFAKVKMLTFAGGILYAVSMALARISALTFQIRVFARGTASSRKYRVWRFANYFVIFLSVGHCIAYISVTSYFLSRFMSPGQSDGVVLSGSLNIVIDVLILILPLPLLGALQTSWRRRAGLIILFVLGYCVPAVSMARVVIAKKLSTSSFGTDTIRYLCIATALVSIELAVAIMSICLPSHLPLMRDAVKSVRTSWSKARPSSEGVLPLRMHTRIERPSQQSIITEDDKVPGTFLMSSSSSVDDKDLFDG